MSRKILISIRPEWVEKILNGEKTIEIRKTMPKCKLPCKVYIYCTKSKPNLCDRRNADIKLADFEFVNNLDSDDVLLNGKVVAEFTLESLDNLIDYGEGIHYVDSEYYILDINYLRRYSCLTDEQISNYLGINKKTNHYNNGYAWNIDNLKIYDRPKELSEFTLPECEKSESACENFKHLEVINTPYAYETNCVKPRKLTKAPQSWCYLQ